MGSFTPYLNGRMAARHQIPNQCDLEGQEAESFLLDIYSRKNWNTCNRIQRQLPNLLVSSSWCIMCKSNLSLRGHLICKSNLVSRHHPFFQYPFAPTSWSKLLNSFGLGWCFLKGCETAISQLLEGSPFKSQALILWSNVVTANLWRLWFRRNQRVFK